MTSENQNTLPLWRRIRRRLYYWLLVSVLWLASRLSLNAGRYLGRNMARLGASVRPVERHRALSNLALAFPEIDKTSRQKIFQQSVVALGENFFDTLKADQLIQRENFFSEESSQAMDNLIDEISRLKQKGQGLLVLTGHLGCWELLGAWVAGAMAESGLGELAVVTGRIHNAPVDRLIQLRRKKMGLKVLPREEGAAPLLRHLRSGGVVAVLLDQNTRVENFSVPFFGQNAPTPVAFARIALRNKVPILPVVLEKRGQGHQVLWTEAWLPGQSSEDPDQALQELLQWCNLSLENFIRRNPAQWVWFHKRWSLEKDSPSS